MAETQEMSSVEKNVARQIEYYFGNYNLPRDKFLQEQLQLDDGWVALETMLKFNRLRRLTEDPGVIASALQKSTAGLLEVSDDKTKIRRSPDKPFPEYNDEYKAALLRRSVYVKGFPIQTTLDDIQEWLIGKGTVESIFMKREEDQFKGSVFLSFDTAELSKRFMERLDITSFKDNELIVLPRLGYFAKKREMHKARAKKEKEEIEQKVAEQEMALLMAANRGSLLRFSGELEQVSKRDFHEVFSGHGTITWINFTSGSREGTLLFDGNAKEAFDKATAANGGTLQVKDCEVMWRVLEGDEEEEVLKKMMEAKMHRGCRGRGRVGYRRGRQSGWAGRGRGMRRQRQGDDEADAPPRPKKRALEDSDVPVAKVAKGENGADALPSPRNDDVPVAKVAMTENGANVLPSPRNDDVPVAKVAMTENGANVPSSSRSDDIPVAKIVKGENGANALPSSRNGDIPVTKVATIDNGEHALPSPENDHVQVDEVAMTENQTNTRVQEVQVQAECALSID